MSENNFGRKALSATKAARRATFADQRRTARAEAAEERKAARTARTAVEQLYALDARLGIGKGAVRERARLQKLVATVSSEGSAEETQKKEVMTNKKNRKHE